MFFHSLPGKLAPGPAFPTSFIWRHTDTGPRCLSGLPRLRHRHVHLGDPHHRHRAVHLPPAPGYRNQDLGESCGPDPEGGWSAICLLPCTFCEIEQRFELGAGGDCKAGLTVMRTKADAQAGHAHASPGCGSSTCPRQCWAPACLSPSTPALLPRPSLGT